MPKIVWNKSHPDIQGLKQERTTPSPALQKDDANSTIRHGSKASWNAFRGSDGTGIYTEATPHFRWLISWLLRLNSRRKMKWWLLFPLPMEP